MMTLPASLVAHALVLAAAIVVPLLVAEVLPAPMEGVRAFFVEPASAPPPPPPPPPPAPRSAAVPVARPSAPPAAPAAFTAPIEVPTSIQPEEQGLELGIEGGVPGGVEGGVPGGVVGGVVGGLPEAPPIERAAVRVGGHIKEPRKIKHVDPVYPEIARDAHVQGIVIIEATIDERGRVTDARVLRGVPLLDTAALDAVRQWAYAPTLLNGVPRPVVMTVTVSFLLRRPAGA